MVKNAKLPPMPKPSRGGAKLPPTPKAGSRGGSKGTLPKPKLPTTTKTTPAKSKANAGNNSFPKTRAEERKEQAKQKRQEKKARAEKRQNRQVKIAGGIANMVAPGSGNVLKAINSNPVGKKLLAAHRKMQMAVSIGILASFILLIVLPAFAIATFSSGLTLPQKMAKDTAMTIVKQDMGAKATEIDTLGSDTKDFSAMPVAMSSTIMDKPLQDGNGAGSDTDLPDGDSGKVIEVAKHWIGVPYLWGGETPKGWDCSGFTMGVYRTALGLVVPHQSQSQKTKGKEIPLSEAKPGDLMASTAHVMIYLGKGENGGVYVIHSPKTGGKVNMRLQPASYVSQFKIYRMFNNNATADYIPKPEELNNGIGADLPTYKLNAFDNWAISNNYFKQAKSNAYPKEAIDGKVPSGASKASFEWESSSRPSLASFDGVLQVRPAVSHYAGKILTFDLKYSDKKAKDAKDKKAKSSKNKKTKDKKAKSKSSKSKSSKDKKSKDKKTKSKDKKSKDKDKDKDKDEDKDKEEAKEDEEEDSSEDTSADASSAGTGTDAILGTGVGPMHIQDGVLDEDKAKSLSYSNRFLSCVISKVSPTGLDPFRLATGWKKADKKREIVDQDAYDEAKKVGSKVLQMLPLDEIDEDKAGKLFDKASKWYNGEKVSEACEEDEVTTDTEQEDATNGGQTEATEGDAIKVTDPDGKERTLSGEEYAFVSDVAKKASESTDKVDQRVGAIEWAILHTGAKDKVDDFIKKLSADWDDGKSIGENVYKAAGDLSAADYDGQEAPARQLAGEGATSITKCGSVGGPGCAGGDFDKNQPLDDSAVYGGPGMSQKEIQAYLEQKGSWLAKNKQETNTRPADQFCKGYESSGSELPSEIIYKTAKSCDVKAQWILVRLQAEQGLISNPNKGNTRNAMGYGCPDGGGCDSKYFGFFNQVYMGSRQLQNYRIGDFKDSLPIGKPTKDLSGNPYTPKNNAARALYLYTPHTGEKDGGGAKGTFTIYKEMFPCSSADEKTDDKDKAKKTSAKSNNLFKGYFEATPAVGGESPDGGFEATPVKNEYGWDGKFSKPYTGPNPPVTSPYGTRVHPVSGQVKKHNGADLGLAEGVPQYAAAPGVVDFAKVYGTCGNAVRINHGEFKGHQWSTMYCHLSRMDVKAGQKVKEGTQIGLTGHTGRVTGPHMHFEVQQDGVAIEPTQFIFDGKEATPVDGMNNDGESTDGGLSSEEVEKAHKAWEACGGQVPESMDTDPSLAPIPGAEAATVKDPTSGGKITPRMKKFYDEAAKAGFGSPPGGIGCWRPDSMRWHPGGTACDYMYKIGTPAKGKDLADGNKFVKWAMKNSERLDVYYLIWQGKIWTRSSGKWKQYGGYGGPTNQNATTGHYDHVHVNVY